MAILPAGPFDRILADEDTAPLYLLSFDKTGWLRDPSTVEDLVQRIHSKDFSDVYLLSHGWNNEFNFAVELYRELFTGYLKMRRRMGLTGGHRPVFVGTVWPSTALVLPWDAAPAMAGGADAAETERDIVASALPERDRAEFERLAKAPELDRAAAMTLASLLVPAFDNAGADSEIAAKPAAGDSATSGSTPGAADVFRLWTEVQTAKPQTSGQTGSRSPFPPDSDDEDPALESALSLNSFDPRNIVRLATVRQMKDRAGTVGANGLAPVVGRLLEASAANKTRLHLLGHSYGAKIILSAALYAPPTPTKFSSILLLQPAISCFAFGTNVFGAPITGGYRPVLDRVARPIISTFSTHDRPLRWFFQIAVRRSSDLAEQKTAAIPPSRYCALGGFGPQGLDSGSTTILIDNFLKTTGADILLQRPGPSFGSDITIVGVNGSQRISGHGDVRNQAIQALLCYLATDEPSAGSQPSGNSASEPSAKPPSESRATAASEKSSGGAVRLSGPIKLVIHHDPAARITIDDSGRIAAADSIIFDLSVGDEQQACLIAESRELLGADAPGFLRQDHSSDAGSSDDCTVESKSPGDFVIPKHIILGLQYALARVFEQEAIWLSLQAPYGFLPLVPWEQLLVPELKRRIFRVSPAPKSVPVSRIRGNIALCFCPPDYLESAEAAQLLDSFLSKVCNSSSFGTRRLSVFVSRAHAGLVQRLAQQWRVLRLVEIVSDSPSTAGSHGTDIQGVANPWLTTVVRDLRESPAVSIAFVCGTALGRHNGVLDLPDPGNGERRSADVRYSAPDRRHVAARQFVEFLENAGVSSIALLQGGDAAATYAARRFQFELSQMQSRPVILIEDFFNGSESYAADGWLALADGRQEYNFGTAAIYAPDDWLESTIVRTFKAIRNIAPLFEPLLSQLPVAATKTSDYISSVAANALRKVQRVDPNVVDNVVANITKSLEGTDSQVPTEYRDALKGFIQQFGTAAAPTAERAIRAGQAQAQAWLRDLDSSVRSREEKS